MGFYDSEFSIFLSNQHKPHPYFSFTHIRIFIVKAFLRLSQKFEVVDIKGRGQNERKNGKKHH